MHIPDGFLDTKTVVATTALAALGVGAALRQARRSLPPHRVPILGLTAAFVFAAQMVNFPVAGGTSGHLMGAVLAAVLLGPGGAVLVLTAVLVVQCLVFADGGLLALGANVFNMGIVGGVGGHALYRAVARLGNGDRGRLGAAAFAAWSSTVLAAVLVAGELSLSGVVAWPVVLPAMAGVHMLIGLGEALITGLVVLALLRTRPELLDDAEPTRPARPLVDVVAFGLVIALGIGLFVSPFASVWPDGLEKVAERLGFVEHAVTQPLVPAPIPDYALPGLSSASWATALAGGVGTVIVFVLSLALARVLVPGGSARIGPLGPRGGRPR
jgi:cobalt/nickel transport system permease protein